MTYQIEWKPRGVIKRFFGHVTDHDMLQSVLEIESDRRFDDLRYVINDFSGITGSSVDVPTVEEIAIADKGASLSNPSIRIAVVTTSPEIRTLAECYAGSPLNAYQMRIFASEGEARSWLGLSAPDQPVQS
ncbi:MAG: hypothetical protein HZC22_15680 [Rhodocyclales bacterium]|nr:hypothetical protein [Rhodocyclales bacterium]